VRGPLFSLQPPRCNLEMSAGTQFGEDAWLGGTEEVIVALAWVGQGTLEGKRVDPTVNNNKAVRLAAENGHVDVVRVLLAWEGQGTLEGKRVKPTACNNCAVRWAAENGHVEVVRELLDWVGQGELEGKRVKPTAKDNQAVQGAVKKGHVDVVRELLDWEGQGTLKGKQVDINVARVAATCDEVLVVCEEAQRARAAWTPLRAEWIGAVFRGGLARRAKRDAASGDGNVIPGRTRRSVRRKPSSE